MIEYIGWYSLASLALNLSKPTPGKECIHEQTYKLSLCYKLGNGKHCIYCSSFGNIVSPPQTRGGAEHWMLGEVCGRVHADTIYFEPAYVADRAAGAPLLAPAGRARWATVNLRKCFHGK